MPLIKLIEQLRISYFQIKVVSKIFAALFYSSHVYALWKIYCLDEMKFDIHKARFLTDWKIIKSYIRISSKNFSVCIMNRLRDMKRSSNVNENLLLVWIMLMNMFPLRVKHHQQVAQVST